MRRYDPEQLRAIGAAKQAQTPPYGTGGSAPTEDRPGRALVHVRLEWLIDVRGTTDRLPDSLRSADGTPQPTVTLYAEEDLRVDEHGKVPPDATGDWETYSRDDLRALIMGDIVDGYSVAGHLPDGQPLDDFDPKAAQEHGL
jgi:hypothetical protein